MADIVAAPSVDVQGALSDMVRAILLVVPKLLVFLLILVVGYLIARLLLKVVDQVLERVGFDRWVERGGVRSALARSKYDASDIVARLVYYAVLLVTLQLAFGVWGPNPISDLIRGVVAWLPRAFVAIVIIVVAAAIASWVKDLISGALGGLSYGRLLANLAAIFIVGLGVIAALNQIGVATTVTTPVLIAILATIAGILIVGVGGGLVRPMQSRWEAWLDRAANESRAMADQARAYAASQRIRQQARTPTAAADPYAGEVPAYAASSGQMPTGQMPAAQMPPGSRTGGSIADDQFASRQPSGPMPTAPPPQPVYPAPDQPTQVIPPAGRRETPNE